MKISVIIPLYNGERYIADCLESMARQTHRDLEIIVVDDGSTDGGAAVARLFEGEGGVGGVGGEGGVRVISLGRNFGPSVARNVGIDAATGEWIHFMDADDVINPRFYELLLAAAVQTDSDIACAGMINGPKPHRTMIFEERRVIVSTAEKLSATNVGRWGYSVRYLFRAELLRSHGLRFEQGRIIEDMPFSLRAVYYSHRLVLVPGAVYTYILRPGSQMSDRSPEHRRRRHRDLRHAKQVRHDFARANRFTIPGVPTRLGHLSLLYVIWLT